jgi:hypothetical protein
MTFPKKGLKSTAGGADNRRVGNYDEMSTARLKWLVLDRIVPKDEEAYARAALIARDPEIQSLVNQGILSEEQAVEAIRTGQTSYGYDEGFIGDRVVLWAKRLATFFGGSFCAFLVLNVAR